MNQNINGRLLVLDDTKLLDTLFGVAIIDGVVPRSPNPSANSNRVAL
jgi:hypothetical protein